MLVAILDDKKNRRAEMRSCLLQSYPEISLELFDNAPDMIAWLARHIEEVDLASLAHDLGPSRLRDGMLFDPGTGRDVADFLVEMDRFFPVIVHTSNGAAGQRMVSVLEDATWPCSRVEAADNPDWVNAVWAPLVAETLSASADD